MSDTSVRCGDCKHFVRDGKCRWYETPESKAKDRPFSHAPFWVWSDCYSDKEQVRRNVTSACPTFLATTDAALSRATGGVDAQADPVAEFIAKRNAAIAADADYCTTCGSVLAWTHDHRPDNSGLDDGPWLPGRAPRKKSAPKTPEELAAIRAAAWSTRRAKYGERGHR